MSREGTNRFIFKPDDYISPPGLVNGRGTVLLVVGLAAATIYSCSTNTDAMDTPFGLFRKEYMPLSDCLETQVASSGLFAICEARDGSSWRVQQSDTKVLVPENALAEDMTLYSEHIEGANFGDASTSFNKPLVLTPENDQQCGQFCAIAAQNENGTWTYYNPTTPLVLQGLNDTLRIITIEPSLAVITKPGPKTN